VPFLEYLKQSVRFYEREIEGILKQDDGSLWHERREVDLQSVDP
jgi:hypothetical protein